MIGLRDACLEQVKRQRPVLRVGYVEARHWRYRSAQCVPGLDTMAVSFVAGKMGCATEYASTLLFWRLGVGMRRAIGAQSAGTEDGVGKTPLIPLRRR